MRAKRKDKFMKGAELLLAAMQQYEQRKIPVPAEVYEHLGMVKRSAWRKNRSNKGI